MHQPDKHELKQFHILVTPRGRRAADGIAFDGGGLIGSYLGRGVYEFCRVDRCCLGMVIAQVQIVSRHADEVVGVVLRRCTVHGMSCDRMGEDCEGEDFLGKAPRWSCYATISFSTSFKVFVVRRPNMKTLADSKMKSVRAFGPALAVILVAR